MSVIKALQDMKQEMTRWRQRLHMSPELAFEERMTARFIAQKLQEFGVEVHTVTKTGVVGVLHGKGGAAADFGGKAILLRADMDALPLDEETGAAYRSGRDGVHHACGHDGHIAMLLGAAKHLAQTRNFDGTVYFVFQPAEESLNGAKTMIKDKLLENFPAEAVFGLHNYPFLPLGTMASGAGVMMAGADEFHISLQGRGGEISRPDETDDLPGAAADIIARINALAEKEITEGMQAALIVSSVTTDSASAGDIASSVRIKGGLRGFDDALREKLKTDVEQIVQQTAEKYGLTFNTAFKNSYPVLVNSEKETALALDAAADTVGAEKVATSLPRTLYAEDFAHFLQEKPGNFMGLGTGRTDGKETPPLHSAKYDFNDAALPIGASYWVKLVEKALPLIKGSYTDTPDAKPAAPKP